jgi:hypothetical protein
MPVKPPPLRLQVACSLTSAVVASSNVAVRVKIWLWPAGTVETPGLRVIALITGLAASAVGFATQNRSAARVRETMRIRRMGIKKRLVVCKNPYKNRITHQVGSIFVNDF